MACVYTKGRTGGGGQISALSRDRSLACCRQALFGAGWAISLLLCMNVLRNQSPGHVGPLFLHFSWGPAEEAVCKLSNDLLSRLALGVP